MKAMIIAAIALLWAGAGHAQQNCVSQYLDAPGKSAAGLIAAGFEIRGAIPGGLWVQKDREAYYCNIGRPRDNELVCWQLREPVKGSPCQ
ncbi:MAG: hypothetical protein K2Y40_24455 [Reyranella sp.]|nr:hypothetical protein [Reyranella sp.]